MLLIADSGSTKTDWCLIKDKGNTSFFETVGFNPYLNTTEEIQDEISKSLLPIINVKDIQSIYYYGAGCSSEKLCETVKSALSQLFRKSEIEVDHDLLGAARALCQNNAGIAAILGTGSNSCVFDGKNITEHHPSLGHMLADEGSGSYIGKNFIKAYLLNQLPGELKLLFEEKFNVSFYTIMETVYKKPFPNRYLASFCSFLSDNIQHPYCRALVKRSFEDFFISYIIRYKDHQKLPFNCVGSIGYYFKNMLTEVCQQFGVQAGSIIKTPMDGLVKYHYKS